MGIDKEALSNSIRVIYGKQRNINGYLTRFIDLEYKLKESNSAEYVKYLLDKYGFCELFERRGFEMLRCSPECDFIGFKDLMINISIGFKLSLRDIEKFVVEMYMIVKANVKKYIYPYVVILLCALKRIDKTIYDKVKLINITYEGLVSSLNEKNINIEECFNHENTIIIKAIVICLLKDNIEISKLK